MSVLAAVVMGNRGRMTLPAPVRAAAGLDEGDEVVAVAEAPGRVVLTSRAAIRAELDAALPPHDAKTPDAVATVRAYREEDITAAEEHLARAEIGTTTIGREEPGPALLRAVGITP